MDNVDYNIKWKVGGVRGGERRPAIAKETSIGIGIERSDLKLSRLIDEGYSKFERQP